MFDQEILRYGYLLLFFGVLVEADAFLIAGAFLAHRGYFDIRLVIILTIAATVLANQAWFWVARIRGRAFLERRLQSDRRVQRVHGWLQRRGNVLIPMSRFLWGFRVAIPAVYGASGARPLVFTMLDSASAVAWGLAVGFAGYAFGHTMEVILEDVQRYERGILAAVFVVAAVLMLRRRTRVTAILEALRQPMAAGGDAVLRLFFLVRRAGRLLVVHPHGRLASLAAALGLLNILTAIVGTRILHVEWLADSLPFEVTHGSRALMLLAGLALVYLGRTLARRKHLAWLLALALSASSVVFYLANHGSVLRAALAAGLAVELWRQRHRFHARTDPIRLRHALAAAPILAVAVSAYGIAGLHEFGHPHPQFGAALHATWLIAGFQDPPLIATTASTLAWVWSLRLLLVVSVGYVLTAAFAPVAWRGYRSHLGHIRVDGLAWQHGVDSMSYFAKQDDKRHFTVDGRAFVGFRVKNRVAIVAGDPVGEADAIPHLVARFVAHCGTNDWIPVFYEASTRYLDEYQRNGLKWFKMGEEAVLALPTWSMSGGAVAKVRQFVNKVRREAPDLRVIEYRRRAPNLEIDDQLEDISSEWLAGKKGGEMGFNLGVFSVEQLADKRTMIAQRADGTVEAFVTWLPYRAGHAVVLDAMRHRQSAQPGVMDLLIAESALAFKREGLQAVSLAVAPLANADDSPALSPYERAVRIIFDHFSQVYGYRTLFQYKKKFAPEWEPRYLVFPRPDLLARIAYALVSVHYARP
ncbi:MAG: phosphatidylglycerol lysyltransferase domain-containing protein [Acidobacteria bacterium]|nr:phosphatidylglycerol lysyltransferase domain-containing protein [Acidobacteriota bacterium]